MIKEQNINKWIFIIPIIGVILTSILLTQLFLSYVKGSYEDEIKSFTLKEEEKIKSLLQTRVNNTINLITKSYANNLDNKKEEIKNLTDIGYEIISTTYAENKTLPREMILKKINEKLRPLKFFENFSGYYFIFDLDGTTLLAPHRPDLEGKNFSKIGNPFAKDFMVFSLQVLKTKNEGYSTWKWYKPNENIAKPKTGYLKAFEPLNIFIGTGKYDEDLISNIKKQMQDLLSLVSYSDGGYIFGYDYFGITISHVKKSLIGENRFNLKSRDRYIVREIIKKGQEIEGSYLKYLASLDPRTGLKSDKISYVKNIPILNWVIGNGVYTSDIVKMINLKKQEMKNRLYETKQKIIIISFAVTLLSIIIMIFVSGRLSDILSGYKNKLERSNKDLEIKVKERTFELEESKKELKELVIRDPLTNLYNRRYFDEISHELILISKRKNTPLCFAIVDIDFFKNVNDTYGHDTGDEVLREVSKTLQRSIRETDVVSRIGGEEFAILFPDTDADDALLVCEKLRILIEKTEFISFSLQQIKFTISIGLTQYNAKKDELDNSLIKRADQGLYDAKDSGRNRVVVKS